MDYKIIIDAGHGGIDSGAVSGTNQEKNINLNISKLIFDKLKNLGLDVYLTRDSDITLDPTNRINKIKELAGNSDKVIVISNHVNSSNNNSSNGSEVIYSLRNNDILANLILNNLKEVPINVRKTYQRVLPTNPTKDYYYILRNTNPFESVIVEYGFINNQGDLNILKNKQNELASATVKAILEYIGYEEVSDTYIVKSGDTLYSISKKFNIPIDEIKRINNLSNDILSIGQVLNLVEPDIIYDEYVVKKGDNLYSISKRFNISQRELMEINNLKSNLLSIGQILKVPQKDVENIIYTVVPGDTLYKISKMYNTTVDNIKEKNNLTSNTLSIGQILII